MPTNLNGVIVYSAREAAQRLHVSHPTVRVLCQTGRLKATKLAGHGWVIEAETLDEFAQTYTPGPSRWDALRNSDS